MRILLVTQVNPELGGVNTGGIATHAEGLSAHLAERGHEVILAADNRPFSRPWPARVDERQVYGLRDFSGPTRAAGLGSTEALKQVRDARSALGGHWKRRVVAAKVAAYRQVLERTRPDIIHVHGLESRATMIAVVDGGRTPTVATMHSTHSIEFATPEMQPVMERNVRWNLERSTDIIYVSEFLRGRCRDLLPGSCERPRAWVVPNPVETASYRPVARDEARRRLGIDPQVDVLLSVGNLIPRKDPRSFVEALIHLRDAGRDVVGIVVGDGPERAALEGLSREAGLGAYLRLEGSKRSSELAAYYSACDVFVLTSLMESFGLVAAEAMLCGRPVVGVPDVLPEVVPPFAGHHVAPKDPAALAEVLARALGSDWDAERIREHALGMDWSARIGRFEEIYAHVIDAHGAAAE